MGGLLTLVHMGELAEETPLQRKNLQLVSYWYFSEEVLNFKALNRSDLMVLLILPVGIILLSKSLHVCGVTVRICHGM